MSYEPYYRRAKNDSYLVHFLNALDLSADQVNRVFSQFGKVMYVQPAKRKSGLCYVGFESLQAVISCVEAFRTSEQYRLIKHKTGDNKTPGYKTPDLKVQDHKTQDHKTQNHKTQDHKTQNHKTQNIRTATEVLVIDIPRHYDVERVYEIFDCKNILAISPIKTTPIGRVTYCHLYFSNYMAACGAVMKYDDSVQSGENGERMIVVPLEDLL